MNEGGSKKYKPVVLAICDGFGVNIDNPESTWKYAKMPTFRSFAENFPLTTLQASGIAVGLPWGQEGNSEVGHLTIGAGRALFHHLPRIISSIDDGTFFQNPAFLGASEFIKKSGGSLHLLGLFSSGSVHAYADHFYALLEFAKKQGIGRVFIHLITDGKDAPPKEGLSVVSQLEERLASQYPFAEIASVTGRFFAMDRDEHWDRIKLAYQCLMEGKGAEFAKASQYIAQSYEKGFTDETLEPAALAAGRGTMQSGDAIIFYNYREDSERELVSAFVTDGFHDFERKKVENLFFVTMTEYDKRFSVKVAFPPLDIVWPLGRAVAEAGLSQLRIAETEKYAHVTYFFNGGTEGAFPKEDRILVHSPQTAHFDEVPEMSAVQVTDAVMNNLEKYDFILVNFANADMVGHTGDFQATVKALEVLDFSLGRIAPKVLEIGGVVLVTADHGNAEDKLYAATGEKRTKHTNNPVPIYFVAEDFRRKIPRSQAEIDMRYRHVSGVITDIAPTVLALLGVRYPAEMSGASLIPKILED